MGLLNITATVTSLADNTVLGELPFVYYPKYNCYACEVDINDLELEEMEEAKVDITLESSDEQITTTYQGESIYIFNTDDSYVKDRTQEDVDRVKELNEKWRYDELSDAEKAEWEAGLKGALKDTDITRIQTLTNQTLDWYIKKYDSFDNTHAYYIDALNFFSSVIPDNLFFYKAGLQTMLVQLNKLITWMYSQPYEDMPDRFEEILANNFWLTYGFNQQIPQAVVEHTDYMAWNDLEIILYVVFLTVIYYNVYVQKRQSTDFRWQGVIEMSGDIFYTNSDVYCGSTLI